MRRSAFGLPVILCMLLCCGQAFALDENFIYKIDSLKWITYAPTNFNPLKKIYPSDSSITEDLKLLFDAGFNAVITYGSQEALAHIPRIARECGFRGVIMGIWNFKDQVELDNAIAMAEYVDGYCVGNEGLYLRYELAELKGAISYVKSQTNRPATTTEEINDYAKGYIVELGDWVFPNVHPYFSNAKGPFEAARWVKNHYRIIKRSAPVNKPVIFKEVSLPTRGDGECNERKQKEFFKLMEQGEVKFAYFEAFDQYWKCHLPVEPYWGLFDKNRRPKKFASEKLKQINSGSRQKARIVPN